MKVLSVCAQKLTAACLQSVATILVAMTLTLSGRFHIISNGEPRFMLIDDQGHWTEILVDEKLARSYGGAAVFNGKRVKVVGEQLRIRTGAVRALSIDFD